MPAVKIMRVWAMASVPTTATCWAITPRSVGVQEVGVEQAEDDDGEHQHDGGAQPRVAVQHALHSLYRRLPVEELLRRVIKNPRWRHSRAPPFEVVGWSLIADTRGDQFRRVFTN